MSSIDMRTESHQILERIDERFLAAVHALLKTYDEPIVGYTMAGEPLYAAEAEQEYLRRIERMKQGEKTSIAQLRKEVREW